MEVVFVHPYREREAMVCSYLGGVNGNWDEL